MSAGHGAIIHAATVEDSTLVGMGATILDGVTVSTCPTLCPTQFLECPASLRLTAACRWLNLHSRIVPVPESHIDDSRCHYVDTNSGKSQIMHPAACVQMQLG